MQERKRNILMYIGKGVGPGGPARLRKLFASKGVAVVEVREFDLVESLEGFDVVVFPGGDHIQQANGIGERGIDMIRKFVAQGGGYVGFCAGAFLGGVCSSNPAFGLRLLPVCFVSSVRKSNEDLRGHVQVKAGEYHDQDAEFPDHSKTLTMAYHNGPLFPEGKVLKKLGITVVASVTECSALPKQFRSKMHRKPCIIKGTHGKGRVLLCGPHPEHTDGLEEFSWSLFEGVCHQEE